MRRTLRALGGLVGSAAFFAGPAHALTINLTFGTGFTGPSNATKRDVAEAAAQVWEATILTDFEVSMTVQEADLSGESGELLARMHSNAQTSSVNTTTGTKLPMSGTIEFTTESGIDFFFDDDPGDNSEFDMTERGGLVGTAKSGGDAEGLYDAYSIFLHEMGHVLGFSGGTGTWNDGEDFNSYDAWADNMSGSTFTFDFLTDGVEGNKDGTGGAQSTVDMVGTSGFHIEESDIVAAMNPFYDEGDRRLLTPIDYEMIADAFHVEVIPEPATGFLLALGLAALAARRERRL